MCFLSNKIAIRNFLLCIGLLLPGCTELGDMVVIEFNLHNHTVKPEELPQELFPGRKRGSSPNCIARRSEVNPMMIGVCVASDGASVSLYRAFRNRFEIKSKGISDEVRASEGYTELLEAASKLRLNFSKRGITFTEGFPKPVRFEVLQKRFDLSR
ncbi:MAG: hypothetical protein CL675_13425 [Bdellovibrionaceae bacterium]|nr:hypothetical protein [Pseudobdellovibrionaceae bacterium]